MRFHVIAGKNHPIRFALYQVDDCVQLFRVGEKTPQFRITKTNDLPAFCQLKRGIKYQVLFDNNDGGVGFVKFQLEQLINGKWNLIGYNYDIQGIINPKVHSFPVFSLWNLPE